MAASQRVLDFSTPLDVGMLDSIIQTFYAAADPQMVRHSLLFRTAGSTARDLDSGSKARGRRAKADASRGPHPARAAG